MHRATTSHAVSWGDGENPTYDDGCGFLILRAAVALAVLLALRAVLGGR